MPPASYCALLLLGFQPLVSLRRAVRLARIDDLIVKIVEYRLVTEAGKRLSGRDETERMNVLSLLSVK